VPLSSLINDIVTSSLKYLSSMFCCRHLLDWDYLRCHLLRSVLSIFTSVNLKFLIKICLIEHLLCVDKRKNENQLLDHLLWT
jgi:hypothetical protein